MILTLRLVLTLFAFTIAPPVTAQPRHLNEPRPATQDETAKADMRRFAEEHFAILGERPESFRVVDQWSQDHVLRWMDFEAVNQVIRIYHLTDRHHPTLRYISHRDGHHERYRPWHPVH